MQQEIDAANSYFEQQPHQMDFTSNHFISNYEDNVTPEPAMKHFYSDRKEAPPRTTSSHHESSSNRGTAYSESKSYGPIFSKAETTKPSSGAGSSARRIKDMFAIISKKGSNSLHRSRGESATSNN